LVITYPTVKEALSRRFLAKLLKESFMKKNLFLSLSALLCLVFIAWPASAAVKVTYGPTPIINGEALDAKDLTIQNDLIAISINAKTPGPWGAPNGGIMDGTVIRNGQIDLDRIAWVDFLPDNWSEFIPKNYKVEVTKDSPEEAEVKIVRDWNGLTIEGFITVKDGEDLVYLKTVFTNTTDKEVKDIFSGYCLWSEGGYFLPLVGIDPNDETVGMVPATGAMADWVVNYDQTWTTALHAPYVDSINYHGMDLHKKLALKPGEKFEFQSWLQILDRGDLAEVIALEMKRKGITPAVISGEVKTIAGAPVNEPTVIFKKDEKFYFWTTGEAGRYQASLPEGNYEVYATGMNFSPGSQAAVKVGPGETTNFNFADVGLPGTLKLTVTDQVSGGPLDAKIVIAEGYIPEVQYLGQKVYFTDLDLEKRGQAEISLAKGEYKLEVENGANFLSQPVQVEVKLDQGEVLEKKAEVLRKFNPSQKNWYTVDLHHHSNILDGNLPPKYVSLWQSARGLDISVVSDHDSAANQAEVGQESVKRGMAFIPSIEISPSWAHFNIFGQPEGVEMTVNVGTATIQEIMADARKIGAKIFALNHPFDTYGYFQSRDTNKIPGGYVEGFDLVEQNAYYIEAHTDQVLKEMYAFWDKGQKIYFSAGTDYHTAIDPYPDTRLAVYQEGSLDTKKILEAILAGQAYVTMGPFIYPETTIFGSEVKVTSEKATIKFMVESIKPIKSVSFIYNGQEIDNQTFSEGLQEGELTYNLKLADPGWYHLILKGDEDKPLLWTNPVWVVK
jgi:hypothetical protein